MEQLLEDLLEATHPYVQEGKLASYIPELLKADPNALGIYVMRTDGKKLVRMLYRHAQSGGRVEDRLFDFANLVSGYFFQLALWLNAQDGFEEIPFVSRNYK